MLCITTEQSRRLDQKCWPPLRLGSPPPCPVLGHKGLHALVTVTGSWETSRQAVWEGTGHPSSSLQGLARCRPQAARTQPWLGTWLGTWLSTCSAMRVLGTRAGLPGSTLRCNAHSLSGSRKCYQVGRLAAQSTLGRHS